jgi:predicted ATPase
VINRVVLRRFKRFDEVEFRLPDHVVLAGPNNTGKTTLLQAIAAWELALRRWKELNDYNVRMAYTFAPIARQAFSSVPLRTFELLWNDRRTGRNIEIEVHLNGRERPITMELHFDSTEQVKVRPHHQVYSGTLRHTDIRSTYIPAMSGLSREEPLYARPETIDELLAQGRPGEVLRNLLYIANQHEVAWRALTESIRKLFNVALLPPQVGAYITAEYTPAGSDRRFDIASAGSGFQQVLMLLALLHTREGNVLLLDEPDAHLHVILQDAIYGELRRVAAERRSQLVIATHSEVLIESVDPRELMLMYGKQPRALADNDEKRQLIRSLGALTHADIMLAETVRGVLYVEDYTDLELLRAFARVLGLERIEELLSKEIVWKWSRAPLPDGLGDHSSREHWRMLKMIRPDLPAVELLDGDSRIAGERNEPGFIQLRWKRYEIESYLFHPAVLRRFVAKLTGGDDTQNIKDLDAYLAKNLPPAFLENPLADPPFLIGTKARTDLLPPALEAAGVQMSYTRYHEIAAEMQPEEVHPEIREKLEQIAAAFAQRP